MPSQFSLAIFDGAKSSEAEIHPVHKSTTLPDRQQWCRKAGNFKAGLTNTLTGYKITPVIRNTT